MGSLTGANQYRFRLALQNVPGGSLGVRRAPDFWLVRSRAVSFGPVLLTEVVEAEWEKLEGENASQAVWKRHDDSDLWIVIGEDLTVSATGTLHSASMISYCDDVGDVFRSSCSGGAERNELRAWPTGEVVEIDPYEGTSIGGSDGSSHGVNTVLIWTRIRSGIDCLPGKLHQDVIITRQSKRGWERRT